MPNYIASKKIKLLFQIFFYIINNMAGIRMDRLYAKYNLYIFLYIFNKI